MNALAHIIHQVVTKNESISDFSLTHLSAHEKDALTQVEHLLSVSPQILAQVLSDLNTDGYWYKQPLIDNEL